MLTVPPQVGLTQHEMTLCSEWNECLYKYSNVWYQNCIMKQGMIVAVLTNPEVTYDIYEFETGIVHRNVEQVQNDESSISRNVWP